MYSAWQVINLMNSKRRLHVLNSISCSKLWDTFWEYTDYCKNVRLNVNFEISLRFCWSHQISIGTWMINRSGLFWALGSECLLAQLQRGAHSELLQARAAIWPELVSCLVVSFTADRIHRHPIIILPLLLSLSTEWEFAILLYNRRIINVA